MKAGGACYCPECFAEKEQKRRIYTELKKRFPSDTAASINSCIHKWMYEKGHSAAYIFYVVTNTKEAQYQRLKGVFGFIYLLNNTDNIKSYEQHLLTQKYRELDERNFAVDKNEAEFLYQSKNGSEWCSVI